MADAPSTRRWFQFRLIWLFVLITAAAGVFAFLWGRAPFTASALLLVRSDSDLAITSTGFRRFKSVPPEQLIRSMHVLSRALQDPSVQHLRMISRQTDPVAWLQQQLTVDYVGSGDQVLRVRLAGRDADETKALLDAIVNAYIGESLTAPTATRPFIPFGSIQVLKRASEDW